MYVCANNLCRFLNSPDGAINGARETRLVSVCVRLRRVTLASVLFVEIYLYPAITSWSNQRAMISQLCIRSVHVFFYLL